MRGIFIAALALTLTMTCSAYAREESATNKRIYEDSKYLEGLNKELKRDYGSRAKDVSLKSCDKITEITVQSGKAYTFFLEMTNSKNEDIFINSKIISFFDKNGRYFTRDKNVLDPGGPWTWSKKLKESKYTLKPGQSIEIIHTQEDWKWKVAAPPSQGSPGFYIQFLVGYDTSNTPNNLKDDEIVSQRVHYVVE